MTEQLTFWTWLKWGYLSQGIELAVMAVGLYAWQAYKKRRKPERCRAALARILRIAEYHAPKSDNESWRNVRDEAMRALEKP